MKDYFKAEKMTVGYNHKPLIEQIDIPLKKGEILTLIGPNGAGKSTILKSIAGQLDILAGAVLLEGRSIKELSISQLSEKMAVVFTDKLKAEMMTCREVVATGRYPYTGRFGILGAEDNRAVEEAMELVQVTELKDRAFEKISDGQRQRVMLARAICQEPEVILLDEPTSFLDVKYKLEFLSVLQRMREQKKWTVIMSLHELELAQRISDKILCVDGKYVDRYGSPEEIFTPGYLKKLFHITAGNYDEVSGDMELERPVGEAKTFVIGGNGCGREVYRMLQRRQIPFMTGILYQNDVDYPVACALAARVVETEGFEPVGEETLKQAKELVKSCDRVICCRREFKTLEMANKELFLYAKELGKQISMCGSGQSE